MPIIVKMAANRLLVLRIDLETPSSEYATPLKLNIKKPSNNIKPIAINDFLLILHLLIQFRLIFSTQLACSDPGELGVTRPTQTKSLILRFKMT
jgi:hypothetical protein